MTKKQKSKTNKAPIMTIGWCWDKNETPNGYSSKPITASSRVDWYTKWENFHFEGKNNKIMTVTASDEIMAKLHPDDQLSK